MQRLESGLEKLQATAETVAELQEALVGEQAIVEEKKAATDALLVHALHLQIRTAMPAFWP